METKRIGKGWLFPALVLTVSILWAGAGQDGEAPRRPGQTAPSEPRLVAFERETAGIGIERLARRLARFRRAGDAENAGRLFALLFPPDAAAGAGTAAKSPSPVATTPSGESGDDSKPIPGDPLCRPVMYSGEEEKHPSIESLGPGGSSSEVVIAAERWSGPVPKDIRVMRSADRGSTWTGSAVIRDDHPLGRPAIRRVSKDRLGVVFTRDWFGSDKDVQFARFSSTLQPEAVGPVEESPLEQDSPALASDTDAFPSPYLYVVYSERDGTSYRIRFRVSPDLGETWSPPRTVAAFNSPRVVDASPSLAFDPFDGSLSVAFVAWQGRSEGIAVSRSTSFGAGWSRAVFISPADALPDIQPRIAAINGTAVVVHEQVLSAEESDIRWAYRLSGATGWNSGGNLAGTPSDERSPDIRVSGTGASERFCASYLEDQTRIVVTSSPVSDPREWTADTDARTGWSPVSGIALAVLPGTGGAARASAVVAWSEGNPDGDIYYGPIFPVPVLSVSPANQDVAYTAGTTTFNVTKSGSGRQDWTATVIAGSAWLTIVSGSSGTNSGTVTAAYLENPGAATRVGTIQVLPTNPAGAPIDVTVTQAGRPLLSVTPAQGLASTGGAGGPFSPASLAYTLLNSGGTALDWTAAATQTWVTVSPAAGNLVPGASVTVTVSINTAANSLAEGSYTDTVTLANITSGDGTTTRPVSLTVTPPPGTLSVSPAGGLISTGNQGGPFAPASLSYTLVNTGVTDLNWTAGATQTWVTVSPAAGTLVPAASTTVTVSINSGANTLTPGTYPDTVTFTNATNGRGSTVRTVSLTVNPPPGALAVTPATGLVSTGSQGGPFAPSSAVYTLQNTGGTALNWTAVASQTWVTVAPASGTLAATASTTVTVSINTGANSLTPGPYTDSVTFTNTTNGSGNTTRPVNLTVTPPPGALTVTPATGLVSTGNQGGPFAPSSAVYTLQNTGGTALDWTAAATQAWVTLSATAGTLPPAASTTVTVSINTIANSLTQGTYTDTVTFTNTTNGTGTAARSVQLTVNPPPGALTVTPATGFTSTGTQGGPFTPVSAIYTLQNTGGTSLNWTAAKAQAWVTLSATAGTLAPAASTSVTVSINAAANALTAGTYTDTVTFTNTTNGSGNTSRLVTLTVNPPPGALTVTPATGFASTGTQGGPFTPASAVYTLQNTGGTPLDWTATKGQAWLSLSTAAGTLAPGVSTTVTVSINSGANSLSPGTHTDTVAFTNATNGNGSTTRPVTLTIDPPPTLSVSPANRDVSFPGGTTTFAVSNTGGGTLTWTAQAVSGGTWLSIQSGSAGSNAGTITAAFTANLATVPRQGIIRVTAPGANGSPKDVTVSQAAGTLILRLQAQRLIEKAWILQWIYGKLVLAVDNPASVPVEKYVFQRKEEGQTYQVRGELAGTALQNGTLTYNDKFLEAGKTYTYKITALDALGAVLSESNEVTI